MSEKKPLLIFGSSVGRDRYTRLRPELGKAVAKLLPIKGWSCNGISLNLGGGKIASADRTFELHRRNYLRFVLGAGFATYVELLRLLSERYEVTLIEPWKELPKATLYPIKQVEALPHGKWHTGSFDWMLACAIAEGYRDITIAGMQFQRGGEPLGAPACISYWVGYAVGLGIRVTVHEDCDTLFKTYQLVESERQYGREDVILIERLPARRHHGKRPPTDR